MVTQLGQSWYTRTDNGQKSLRRYGRTALPVGVQPSNQVLGTILMGASNAEARGFGYDATGVDAYPTGFSMLNPANSQLVPAVEPLLSGSLVTTGMGPGPGFAKAMRAAGETRAGVFIDAARGGTGYVTPNSNGANTAYGNMSWRTDLPDTTDNLFERMVDLWNAAAAAVAAQGKVLVPYAVIFNAGTTDSTITLTNGTDAAATSANAAAKDLWKTRTRALIAGVRSRISATVPFLFLESSPAVMGELRHVTIRNAARELTTELPYTAYAVGPAGNNAYYNTNASGVLDPTHYSAVGQRLMGGYLFDVLNDAESNTPATALAMDTIRTRLAQANTRAVRMIVSGSSTPEGLNASDQNVTAFVPVLAGKLNTKYGGGAAQPVVRKGSTGNFPNPSTAPGVHVFNTGQGGTVTGPYTGIVAEPYLTDAESDTLALLTADIHLHMATSNDFDLGIPPATSKANLLARIAYLKTKSPNTMHVVIHPHQRLDPGTHVATWAEYKTAIDGVVASDPVRVGEIDASAIPSNLLTADQIHLGDEGHALLAQILFDALTGTTSSNLPVDIPGTVSIATGYQVPVPQAGVPRVKWSALWKTGDGESLMALNQRIIDAGYGTSGAEVELDNGMDLTHGDFTQSNYSIFAPRCRGLIAPGGPQQVRVSMLPMSSTRGAEVPQQVAGGSGTNNFWCMRLGPNNSSTSVPVTVWGITFEGTDQGHAYNGLVNYMGGIGTLYENIILLGYGLAVWNSPPGECNQFASYSGVYSSTQVVSTIRGVRASGIRSDGVRAGGAFATTGAGRVLYDDVHVTDSIASGVTFGTNGNVFTGGLTRQVETKNMLVRENANWSAADGQSFGGVNHEGVLSVRHENTKITLRQGVKKKEHFAFGNVQAPATVDIINPIWYDSPHASGALALSVPTSYAGTTNLQTWDTITITLPASHPLRVPFGTPTTLIGVKHNAVGASTVDKAQYYIQYDTSL